MSTATARLTMTIKPELKAMVDEIAKEKKTNRSKIISECLEGLIRDRKEQLMIKYYKTMAKEHNDFAKTSVPIIQKIASSWGD